jgi:hypothetical protein
MKEVPSLFKELYDSGSAKKTGEKLIWKMEGKLASMEQRVYHVYFDVPGTGRLSAAYSEAEMMPLIEAGQMGVNILPNSGFEEFDNNAGGARIGWAEVNGTAGTTGRWGLTSKEKHGGNYSMNMCNPSSTGKMCQIMHGGWKSTVEAKPNRKYKISGWIKAKGAGAQSIRIDFMDAKWEVDTAYKYYAGKDARSANEWVPAEAVLTSPPFTRYVTATLSIGNQCDAYFDDVEIKEIPAEDPPDCFVGKAEKMR